MRTIARDLVTGLSGTIYGDDVRFAEDFALRVQSAYFGWSPELHEPLRAWTKRNREATVTRDLAAMAAVAGEFDGYISGLMETRRTALDAPADLTTRLLSERVEGELLSDDEIVSILRNWTVGELGTIAASAGIIAQYLAAHLDVQNRLRADPTLLPAAIDEILRINAPLVSNRRVTTTSVQIGGQHLRAGERLTILWASANRDEAVFGDPDELRLDRDPTLNLLYGAGIHVCPGAQLARLELRVLAEELLTGTQRLELVSNYGPVRAVFPGGGFATLPLRVY